MAVFLPSRARQLSEPTLYQASLNTRALQPVEAAWKQAKELAEGNIAQGDAMADCANQIAIIQSSEYRPAETAFRDMHARQEAILDRLAPRVRTRL